MYYAAINSDGSIGSFSSTQSFLGGNRAWFGAVAYQGYMYVMGGCGGAWTTAGCGTSGNNSTVYSNPINSNGTLSATWTLTTALPNSMYGIAVAVYNGYIYIFGGLHLTTFRTQIIYNTIGNGAVGATWNTSAQSFGTAKAYAAATAYNGYVYIVGGCTAGAFTCSSASSNVHYATAGNGDIGTLTQASSSITNGRGLLAVAAANGYLYISGGLSNGTRYKDTQYFAIATSGSTGTWSTSVASTLSAAMDGVGMAACDGNLYVSGGYDGTTYYATVQIAPILSGGSGASGSWTTTSSNFSTTARYSNATVAYNGYMYILGGFDTTYENNVYHAAISSNGSLGSWSSGGTDASFTNARYEFGAAAYNGYLYMAGGVDCSTNYQDAEYASLDPSTGIVGTWTDSSNLFTNKRSNLGVTIYNGYLYIAGGQQASTYYYDVQYSLINTSDGSIGAFSTTTPFEFARYGLQLMAFNGYMYMLGGYDGTTYHSDIQVAPISPNGGIGTWNTSIASTGMTARELFGAATYKGNLYVAGGTNSGGSLNTTQYASLSTIGRIGQFSKLIDLGTLSQVTSITHSGSLLNADASMNFEMAYPDGVFGSASTSSVIPLCPTNPDDGRYIWMQVTIDDVTVASFPDVNGTVSNLTDFTVNHSSGHPSPGTRLRTGAYFCNGVLRPFDTFGP